jgi:hypothetical protein
VFNHIHPGTAVARRLLTVAFAVFTATATEAAQAPRAGTAPKCQAPRSLVRVAELPEGSGIAASRRVPGRVWAHNDSGAPVLVALDSGGKAAGRVRLTGATVEDWEAIAVGPCPAGSCLYVADIGDNEAERKRVTIYRLPEPENASGTAAVADVFHATFPDGAHDAEAVLVTGEGRIHIVTKGETGPVALYRFPAAVKSGATATLERVSGGGGAKSADARITDGSVSPDGRWVALRTLKDITFYAAADFFAGQWAPAARVDLSALKEPQGEGISLGADNTVYVAGEGGGRGPGTFARFTCVPGE